jgi:sirohydrochlorin cobaltochelatase
MANMNDRQGILLFAHGARDPAWALPFQSAARRLAARAQAEGTHVRLAFLEFMTPDILAAGEDLWAQGCRSVSVVPLFLGAGGHVRKDLPNLLQTLSERHPEVTWRLCPAVGETEALIQALADAAWALSHSDVPPAHP